MLPSGAKRNGKNRKILRMDIAGRMEGVCAMKLIIAIVQDEDASRLIGHLMNDGFSVT